MQPTVIGWIYFFAFGSIRTSAPGNGPSVSFLIPQLKSLPTGYENLHIYGEAEELDIKKVLSKKKKKSAVELHARILRKRLSNIPVWGPKMMEIIC